jgi:hypothetical protein
MLCMGKRGLRAATNFYTGEITFYDNRNNLRELAVTMMHEMNNSAKRFVGLYAR